VDSKVKNRGMSASPVIFPQKICLWHNSGAVGHSEKHYKGFKEATVGVKGRFPFISGLDAYIIETPVDIQFCEIPGSAELGDEFGDEGERIFILDGYSIQGTVVLD